MSVPRSSLRLATAATAVAALVVACGSTSVTPSTSPAPSASSRATPVGLPSPTARPTPTTDPPPTPTPTQRPIRTPDLSSSPASLSPSGSPQPTPEPTTYPRGSVIVTFGVGDEEYRVLLTRRANIRIARALLRGEQRPSIPNGVVVRGDPGVNVGWSWHIEPGSLEFADVTTEVCDGLPSYVEQGLITGDRFCPWTATVLAIDSATP